jgi:hypothetical protein
MSDPIPIAVAGVISEDSSTQVQALYPSSTITPTADFNIVFNRMVLQSFNGDSVEAPADLKGCAYRRWRPIRNALTMAAAAPKKPIPRALSPFAPPGGSIVNPATVNGTPLQYHLAIGLATSDRRGKSYRRGL